MLVVDPDRLLTFAEGCDIIQMSPRWTWEQVKQGFLPHVRCGRNIRFLRSSLIAWAAQREKGGKP